MDHARGQLRQSQARVEPAGRQRRDGARRVADGQAPRVGQVRQHAADGNAPATALDEPCRRAN